MSESTFSKGKATTADGRKVDVVVENKPNENGGNDVVIHVPPLNMASQAQK